MKLDEFYTLEGETYNWILRYESEEKVNDKGKKHKTTNEWYFPKIEMALKKYTDESLKPCATIEDIKDKLAQLNKVIKQASLK